MKKTIIILNTLFFIISISAYGQENEFDCELTHSDYMNFTMEKFDSVTIAYGFDDNKEINGSFPSDKNELNTFIIKDVARLSKPEIKKLHQWFLSEKSFTNGVVLNHGDIVISYYKNDTVTIRCTISTITRKFAFVNGEHYFNQSITPAFEKYLTTLMRKKKLLSKKEGFFKFD